MFVTSPSPENLQTLFEFVFKGFDALEFQVCNLKKCNIKKSLKHLRDRSD